MDDSSVMLLSVVVVMSPSSAVAATSSSGVEDALRECLGDLASSQERHHALALLALELLVLLATHRGRDGVLGREALIEQLLGLFEDVRARSTLEAFEIRQQHLELLLADDVGVVDVSQQEYLAQLLELPVLARIVELPQVGQCRFALYDRHAIDSRRRCSGGGSRSGRGALLAAAVVIVVAAVGIGTGVVARGSSGLLLGFFECIELGLLLASLRSLLALLGPLKAVLLAA